ncbi:MAG: MATE family efflux transporter [Clostridiales bacterium GWF2_38_85]|nr:MAG: MATE family efflux transporter [Clostridiales bacterium GWF2_38_85]HBL83594.1 MATE family efflux transporter [Clostridiales bacterium]
MEYLLKLGNLFKKLYVPELMIKEKDKLGEIPDTRSVYSELFRIAWPAVIESLLVGLVGFIDTIMVSDVRYGIAATGLTGQPRMVFYAVFFAINIAVTAIVSRRKGQGDREGARKTLSQSVSLILILGVIMVGTALLVAEPLMIFAGANEDTIIDSTNYFRITMVGLLFTSIGMTINAAQRGVGNTKIAMRTNMVANLVNVVFNYMLISGNFGFPAWGVTGAAVATLLANITSCTLSVLSLVKPDSFLHIKFNELFKFSSLVMKTITRISVSAGVEQIFMRVGFFAYTKMVAELGTNSFEAHQICMTIISMSFVFGDGLGIAASSLVGQNLGKKRKDLATIFGKASQRVGIVFSVGLITLFVFGGEMLMRLFTDDPEIISIGIIILYIIAASSPAQISQVIYSGCLRGAGDTKYVAATSLISIAIIRPIITYILCYPLGIGVIGAWISLIVDQYTRLLLSATRFSGDKWCRIKV